MSAIQIAFVRKTEEPIKCCGSTLGKINVFLLYQFCPFRGAPLHLTSCLLLLSTSKRLEQANRVRRDRIIRLQRARRGKAYAFVIRCHLFATTCLATAAGRCNFIVEHCCGKRSLTVACGARRGSFSLSPPVLSVVVFTVFSETRWIVTCNKSEAPSRAYSCSLHAYLWLAPRLVAWCFWEPERVNQCRKGRKVSVRTTFWSRFARYRRECGMCVSVAE